MNKEELSAQWRAGRAPYQKVVMLNKKKLLQYLRDHPNITAKEFMAGTHSSICNVEKYAKKKKIDGEFRYTALTLDELIEKEEKKENERVSRASY